MNPTTYSLLDQEATLIFFLYVTNATYVDYFSAGKQLHIGKKSCFLMTHGAFNLQFNPVSSSPSFFSFFFFLCRPYLSSS